jgi:hypothetical protein
MDCRRVVPVVVALRIVRRRVVAFPVTTPDVVAFRLDCRRVIAFPVNVNNVVAPKLHLVADVEAGNVKRLVDQGSGVLVVARCCLDGWLVAGLRSRPVRRVWV